jgi:hypothetical protein
VGSTALGSIQDHQPLLASWLLLLLLLLVVVFLIPGVQMLLMPLLGPSLPTLLICI